MTGNQEMGAVVFDMDGVLIDTEPVWRDILVEVFTDLGSTIDHETAADTMGVPIADVVSLWYTRRPWTGPSIPDVTDRVSALVAERIAAAGEPMRGVTAALHAVRSAGMRSAIASSSSHALIATVVDRLGIASLLDVVCSADDEVAGKPHPAVFRRAAERLGVPPQRCIAVEDSINGVTAAVAAGMYCVAIPDPHAADHPTIATAHERMDSLEEMTVDWLRSVRPLPHAAAAELHERTH